MRAGLALLVVSLSAPAFAQAPPPPPPPDPAMQPAATEVAAPAGSGLVLPNMLSTRYGGTVDARLDYSHFSGDGGFLFNEDVLLLGMTLHGQYLWPQNYGAYITLPYYYASADDDSENGFGNIELGGLYKLPQGPTGELLLRGAFALDSAGQIDALFAPLSQLSPRLYDAYPSSGFATNWAKAEGSFRHYAGTLVLGIAAGIDVPFGGDDDTGFDAIAKGALSIGIDNPGSVGFGIGLSMLYAIGTESDDDAFYGLNATASFPISPTMSLYGAFGLPDLENNIDELDLFSIGAGIRAAVN